jgi:hypothetical protein
MYRKWNRFAAPAMKKQILFISPVGKPTKRSQ